MNPILYEKMSQKVKEITEQVSQMRVLAEMLGYDPTEEFIRGMITGRLYNSFIYQSRRLQKRNPTNDEMDEFSDLIKSVWRIY
ncbi:MAG: hypothetical protein F4Y18_03270 [Cenarchaeum sp. SB0663_bin_5]|nr:hypothetical protein [Cenarchaeum sp. SB0663_bin_5]MYH04403.1 hypothetical protein [Cenarchaeum sp. SB0675_bin_21]MYL12099.1 hypothetical protein [Cenarchaeum sp. SB0669_bin_11]